MGKSGQTKPGPDELLKAILATSGNSFHYRVVGKLRMEGWTVVVAPYYEDTFKGIPREIDINASKTFPVMDSDQQVGSVEVRLFIECKYVREDTVTAVWFDPIDETSAESLVRRTMFLAEAHETQDHHFLKQPRVAKLFSSARPGEQRKENLANDQFMYDAITQSLHALASNRPGSPVKKTSVASQYVGKSSLASHQVTLCYPVIVFSSMSGFHDVSSQEPNKISRYFPIEMNYVFHDKSGNASPEYFIIDAIEFDAWQDYSALLKQDIKAVKDKIYWNSRHQ